MSKKEIFLENLPKKGKSINWRESIGYKVNFVYDDIEDELEIIDYNLKKGRLLIKYNNKEFEISTYHFTDCKLGVMLNKYNSGFKIDIGTIFKDDKRDYIITKREYRIINRLDGKIENRRWYEYHCNKCGVNLWKEEQSILNNVGCGCCGKYYKTIIKGVNDLATTNPEMVKYFVNINDCYSFSFNSKYKTLVKCPDCGYKKNMRIDILYNKGFSCPQCSDGISYPEKVMFNVLEQLKESEQLNDFIYQYTKTNAKWCDKYKYDFYFEKDGEEYIIETHGVQHYKNNFRSLNKNNPQQEQQNDKDKYNLAIRNGIKPENYIIIDCRESETNFIKNNILHSKLNEICNLNNVDWNKTAKYSEKNLVKEVCDYWHLHNDINNKNLNSVSLSNIFRLSRTTINKYLKKGTKLGWCNYNPKEELIKGRKKTSLGKQIEIFKDNKSLGIFISGAELERQSEKLFGIKLIQSCISKVAKGEQKEHKGFNFKYV